MFASPSVTDVSGATNRFPSSGITGSSSPPCASFSIKDNLLIEIVCSPSGVSAPSNLPNIKPKIAFAYDAAALTSNLIVVTSSATNAWIGLASTAQLPPFSCTITCTDLAIELARIISTS